MTSDKRTCPWCGAVDVYAFSEEALTRALATHLLDCTGADIALPVVDDPVD